MAFHPTLSKSGRIMFWPLIKFTEFMGNHFPETLLKIRYRYVVSILLLVSYGILFVKVSVRI